MDGQVVLASLRKRHERSAQPSSRTLVAVIDSITEILQSSGLTFSVIAVFAAVMSQLELDATLENEEVVTALCVVLGAVMQQTPASYIRSKFSTISAVVCKVITRRRGCPAVLKPSAGCLASTLCALDASGDWAPVTQPFRLLVDLTLDGNPKVRKLAVDGLTEVVASVRSTPAQKHAAAELLKVAKVVLAGPKLAARAAADAPQSKRPALEEAIVKSVQDCLHLMGALKPLLPVLPEAAALETCDLLMKLLSLQQALLSGLAVDCLAALASGAANTGNVAPAKLQLLFKAVLAQEAVFQQQDPNTQVRVTRLLQEFTVALGRLDARLCTAVLPGAVAKLTPLLAAEQDGVRLVAAEALKAVFGHCITPEVVESAKVDAASGAGPQGLVRVILSLATTLGASYADAWPGALPVVAELLRRLGPGAAPLTAPLVAALVSMCRGSADASEAAGQAQAALGVTIATQGPESVLSEAPLHEGGALVEANTWLLPLLRKYVVGSRLALWGTEVLPLARRVGGLASAAHAAGKGMEHFKLAALELQMWHCLGAFANAAVDVPEAMATYGETLGLAFHNRADLQAPICSALKRICRQTSAALQHGGDEDGAGFDRGAEVMREADDGADDEDGTPSKAAASPAEPEALLPLERARANRDCLRAAAQKWLSELLNRFAASPPEERGLLGETIKAMAVVAGEALAAVFYKEAMKKLIAALQGLQALEAGNGADVVIADPAAEVSTFLELALLMAPALRGAAMAPLYKAVKPALTSASSAVQKKAFRALAYLTACRPDFLRENVVDIVATILDGSKTHTAAKRRRLESLQPVILFVVKEQPDLSAVPPAALAAGGGDVVGGLVAELVLCTKEVNQKTRAQAYLLLVSLAHALHEAQPPTLSMDMDVDASDLSNGGLQRLFARILAGVASTTPRMVSASVMALARLLFEFGPDLQLVVAQLIPPVCMLLRSKAREVIKSVLGFLKVCTMRVPPDLLTPHLATILEGVLLWAEDSKNRMKLKVRHVVERLARRCGFDAVRAAMPPSEAKLMASITKDHARRLRRKHGGSDDGGGGDDDGTSSRGGAKTARASDWGKTDIFSDDDDEDAGGRARSVKSRAASKAASKVTVARNGKDGKGRARLSDADGDPVNLLDASTSRHLVRTAAGREAAAEADDFSRDLAGKMIIREEPDPFSDPYATKRKRKAADDSDDSDMEDLKGLAGFAQAFKSTEHAKSLSKVNSYVRSMGDKTVASRRSKAVTTASRAKTAKTARSGGSDVAGGKRFAAKKAHGDVKGSSKVEPFAYWKLDRSLLNRRKAKSRGASDKLGDLVNADAPERGSKAKRRKYQT